MPMERSRSDRGRDMSQSYTHVGKYPAQNERSRIHGIFEREKQLDDISEMGNMKFAYRNREFWCKGYYVDTYVYDDYALEELFLANTDVETFFQGYKSLEITSIDVLSNDGEDAACEVSAILSYEVNLNGNSTTQKLI